MVWVRNLAYTVPTNIHSSRHHSLYISIQQELEAGSGWKSDISAMMNLVAVAICLATIISSKADDHVVIKGVGLLESKKIARKDTNISD